MKTVIWIFRPHPPDQRMSAIVCSNLLPGELSRAGSCIRLRVGARAMESRLYILLVDGDHTDLALFGMAADKTDLDIWLQTLTAGQQAIDYLEAKGGYSDSSLHPLPDVVVMDLKMPRVSGFDFLAWRKVSPVFSSIPVVILSGTNDPTETRRAVEMGANKHVVKPTDFEDWKRVVREIWDFGTQGTAFYRADQLRRGRSG